MPGLDPGIHPFSKRSIAGSSPAMAPLALVFSANATGIPGIKVSGVFPRNSPPPIVFPAAILRDSRNAEAERFLAFLGSPPAMTIFKRFGYQPLATAH